MIDITSKKAGEIISYSTLIALILSIFLVEFFLPFKESIQTLIEIIIMSPFLILLVYIYLKKQKRYQ